MEVVLQHDLLGRMLETQRGQPAAVGDRPGPSAGMDAAMSEQETLQVLECLTEHPHRRGSGADQVAHRLMRRIRNPHRRELASPMQLGQANLENS
jgi:hypothetical protein